MAASGRKSMNANATQRTRSRGPLRAPSPAEMCMCTCGLLRSLAATLETVGVVIPIDQLYTVVARMNRAFINRHTGV